MKVKCAGCKAELFDSDQLCIFNPVRNESHLLLKPTLLPLPTLSLGESRDFFCAACGAVIGHFQTFGIALKPLLVISVRRIVFGEDEEGKKLTVEELKPLLAHFNWKTLLSLENIEKEKVISSITKHKHLPLLHPTSDDLMNFAHTLTKHPPRPYQWESLALCALSPHNSILYLPTGAGKTLVSSLMCALYKRLNPDRLVVFLTDRVPLVFQQARAIEEQTGLLCLAVAGDVQLNLPPAELLQYDVLVCTVQLWINLLLKREAGEAGLLESVSLVVIDEVHHATRSHPFVVFFESFLQPLKESQGWSPRVLGLTASPASGRGLQMKIQLEQLEGTLEGKICMPVLYRSSLEEATQRPQLQFITVAPFTVGQAAMLAERIAELKGALEAALSVKLSPAVTFEELRGMVKTVNDGNQLAAIYRLFSRIELVNLIGIDSEAEDDGAEESTKTTSAIDSNSPKFKALVEFLNGLQVNDDSRVIVFVETKRAAKLLSAHLKPLLLSPSWNPHPFVGQSSGSLEGMSWTDQQRPLLAMFHSGLVKLLIATSVLQEGLDVAACNHIVAFDRAASLQSFLQSRGRARARGSKYTVICAPDEEQHYGQLMAQEAQMKGMVLREMAERSVMNLNFALSAIRLVVDAVGGIEVESGLEIEGETESDADAESEDIIQESLAADVDYFDVEALVIGLQDNTCTTRLMPFPPIVLKRPLSLQQLSNDHLSSDGSYDLNGFDRVLGLSSPSTLPLQLPFDALSVGVMRSAEVFAAFTGALTGESFTIDPVQQLMVIKCAEESFSLQCPFAFIDGFCLLSAGEDAYSLTLPLKKPALLFKGEEKRCTASGAPCQGFGQGNALMLQLPLNASSSKFLLAALKNIPVRQLYSKTPVNIEELTGSGDDSLQAALSCAKNRYLITCMIDGTWRSSSLRLDASFVESADAQIERNHGVVDAFIAAMNKSRFADPLAVLQAIDPSLLPSPSQSLNDSFAQVKLVTWTPSRVICHPPQLMMSNRVLRHFGPENFIRLHFRDEQGDKLSLSVAEGGMDGLLDEQLPGTVGWCLKNHFWIEGKEFRFLAMSASQLRNHSAWFTCLDAEAVRGWLGDFRGIRNVAKYVARLGQSLSASQAVGDVTEFKMIPDWESAGGGFCFSDGCGWMSRGLAERVAAELKLPSVPSAIQIRFAGFKGVVAINDAAPDGTQLALRPSMKKFDSTSRSLDVLNYSQPFPAFLNRQIILILSARGVPDEVFLQMQHEHLRALAEGDAASGLRVSGLSIDRIPAGDAFKRAVAHLHYQQSIRELVSRSRIAVPQGRVLMGVVDESGMLEEGQVFCQIDGEGVIEGPVVVAKNPCMHPGDLRILEGCRVEALMRSHGNVIVFPRKGPRPIPDMCSGSDLDGDLYFVTWDKRLIPPIKEAEPMDYSGLPAVELENAVSVDDVRGFLLNYLANDRLGSIANAHMVFADRFPDGVSNPVCQSLARIFALAVDFPKTGFMAQLPVQARVREYTDFMEKTDKPVYASEKVIGKLFRELKQLAGMMNGHELSDWADVTEEQVDGALKAIYQKYRRGVEECLRLCGLRSEAQLWLGLSGEVQDAFKDLSAELIESAQTRLRMLVAEVRRELMPFAGNPDLFRVCDGAATAFPWLIQSGGAQGKSAAVAAKTGFSVDGFLKRIYERTVQIITDCLSPLGELSSACTVDWIALLLDCEEIAVNFSECKESIDSLKAKCLELNLSNSVQSESTLIIRIAGKRLICHTAPIQPSAPALKSAIDFWIQFCLKAVNRGLVADQLPSAHFVNPSQFPELLVEWMQWLADVDGKALIAELKGRLNNLSASQSAAFTAYHLLTWSGNDLSWTLSRLSASSALNSAARSAPLKRSLKVLAKAGSTGRNVDGALRLFAPVPDESANCLAFTSFSNAFRPHSNDPCFRLTSKHPQLPFTGQFADFWSFAHRQLSLLSRMLQDGHELKLTLRRGQYYASQAPSVLLENSFSLRLLRMSLDRSFKKQRLRVGKKEEAGGGVDNDRYDLKPMQKQHQRDQSKIHAALESLLNDNGEDDEASPSGPPAKKTKVSFFGKLAMHFESGTNANASEFTARADGCLYVCSLEVFDRLRGENVGLRIVLDAQFKAKSIRSRALRWLVADFVNLSSNEAFNDRRLILSSSTDVSGQFPEGYFDDLVQVDASSGQLYLNERFRGNETVHVRQMAPTLKANHFLTREFSIPEQRSGVFRLQTPLKVENEENIDVDVAGMGSVTGRDALIRQIWKLHK